jgi:hypothetical protein
LAPGQSATVTNTGTSSAAIFNFGIPAGQPGAGGGPASFTLTTTDVGGPANLNTTSSILNVPQYQRQLQVTNTGSGNATLTPCASPCAVGGLDTLNIPPSTGGGITLPSGALTGQNLTVGAGSTVASASPGLTDAGTSPIGASMLPNCGTTDTGDRARPFVVTANITITVPASSTTCASAIFYFLFQSPATFARPSGGTDTFDVYDGNTHSVVTSYTVTSGMYVTIFNGTAGTWHFLVEGPSTGGGGPTYTAAPPISITGTTIGMTPGTANGQVLTWNGTAWVAAAPTGGGGTIGTPLNQVPIHTMAVTNPTGNNMDFSAGPLNSATFTPITNGQAFIDVNVVTTNSSTTINTAATQVKVYRTTGAAPAAGAAATGTVVLTLQTAYNSVNVASLSYALSGGLFDNGLTVGTMYTYYLALDSFGTTGVASLAANGLVQITERDGSTLNQTAIPTAAVTNPATVAIVASAGPANSVSLTPNSSGNVLVAFNAFTHTTSTGAVTTGPHATIQIFRTTTAVPVAGTAVSTPTNGVQVIYFSRTGVVTAATGGAWINGVAYDIGLTPGVTYNYYMVLASGVSGVATMDAGGVLQATEQSTAQSNIAAMSVTNGTTAAANMDYVQPNSIPFTPAINSEALVTVQGGGSIAGISNQQAAIIAKIWRTTGTAPAAGTVDPGTNTLVLGVRTGYITASNLFQMLGGAFYDTGLVVGTTYNYYATFNTNQGTTATMALNLQVTERAGAVISTTSLKPGFNDGIQYVSPQNGVDSNDGLSWGSARQSIQAAYNALPAIGGVINIASTSTMPNGCLSFSTPIVIGADGNSDKHVQIRGAGQYVTCLNFTGTTGPAITIETDHSSSISDLYLETQVTNSPNVPTMIGIQVGEDPAIDTTHIHTCNKCSFTRVNVGGFDTDVWNYGYGTYWDQNQLNDCLGGQASPSATYNNSTGFYEFGDATRITGAEIQGCLWGVYDDSTGTTMMSKAVMQNNGTAVTLDNGGKFSCTQCTWSTTSTGPLSDWIETTTPSEIVVSDSTFNSTRTTNTAGTMAFVFLIGGQFIFQNNTIYSATETVTRFANLSTNPAVQQINGNMNNIILTLTTVPAFSNVAPPANTLVYQ